MAASCAMPEPAPGFEDERIADGLSVDAWLGGRLSLAPTETRASDRHGRRPAGRRRRERRGPDRRRRRRRRRGRAGARQPRRALERRSGRNRRRSGAARRRQRGAQRADGARARICRSTWATPAPGARRGSPTKSADCVVTNPPYFDPGTVRVSPDPARARAHAFPSSRYGRAAARRLDPRLPCASGARRALRDDPPARGAGADSRGNRRTGSARSRFCPSIRAPAPRPIVSSSPGSRAPRRRFASRRRSSCMTRTAG